MTNDILETIKDVVQEQDERVNGFNKVQIQTIYETVWNAILEPFSNDSWGEKEY